MNNLKLSIFFIAVFTPISLLCQDRIIDISKNNGVYYLQCKINGYPIQFILDSGASDVIISEKEAEVLKAQGLISNSDFINTESYEIADGSIIESRRLTVSNFRIGDIILRDVVVSVTDGPLLLGNNVFKEFRKIELNKSKNTLIIKH